MNEIKSECIMLYFPLLKCGKMQCQIVDFVPYISMCCKESGGNVLQPKI